MRIVALIPFLFYLFFCGQIFFLRESKKLLRTIRGHNVFSITIHLPCTPPTVTVCRRCYKRSKKSSQKDLAHPEDHLERSLKPIHATQVNTGPFWTRQKKTFRLQIKILRLETYFPLKERHNSLSFWNRCALLILPLSIRGWFKIQTILKQKQKSGKNTFF